MEEEKKSVGVRVGDITGISGQVNIAGHDIYATHYSKESAEELTNLFTRLYQKVETLPDGPDRAAARSAVQGLEVEAKQGEKADESRVSKWLTFLAQTAPDAFEVAVATFLNPIKGLGLAFQKVAERINAERGAG